jgi:hypothetical protein
VVVVETEVVWSMLSLVRGKSSPVLLAAQMNAAFFQPPLEIRCLRHPYIHA